MSQLDLFARRAVARTSVLAPEPNEIRARMESALSELAGAELMPWPQKKLDVWRTIWPQMVRWLPDEEQAELRRRFEEQIARLAAACSS